ncbi:MAG TPA: DUF2203 family protein [Thermohalobaculum sp.]|nr:DUF2203 family protein [Thermohalobaculum sp.]
MISKQIARRFDREGAEATLPLVRRIVADIERDNDHLQAILPELRALRMQARRRGEAPGELEALREQVADITTRFEGYLAELARIGCVYRGVTGHVDFRGEHEGRPVFFCWAPGEDEVSCLHLLGSDCRLREPIGLDAALPFGRP